MPQKGTRGAKRSERRLRFSLSLLTVLVCLLCLFVASLFASGAARAVDFSELDKLVPEELKEKNTPGAVGRVDGKQVLSTSLISQMVQHHIPVPGETDSYYGYGLTIFKYKSFEFVAHGGFSRGYGSMIQMVPSQKFAVIVLTNKSGESLRKTSNKATQLALGLKDDGPEKPAAFAPVTAAEMNDKSGKIEFLFTELYAAKKK